MTAPLVSAATKLTDGATFPLWPEGVPGAKNIGEEIWEDGRVRNVSTPTLQYFAPAIDRPGRNAIIIVPGGSYILSSYAREGIQYARSLGSMGVTAFVLKPRLQEFGHPAPLQDVLRAVRLVRSRAAEFGIDPQRVGLMGSSAGGHLSATAGTLFNHPAGKTGHALDAVSGRPDFMILMYPVITMDDPAAHANSRRALLGETPSPENLRLMSLEKQVTAQTPPTLLIHTQADKSVPIENAILFFQALTRAEVPAELYAYEKGEHGMGMRDGLGTTSEWPKRLEEWLKSRGLLIP
jgi:acetyl esterase/lipase